MKTWPSIFVITLAATPLLVGNAYAHSNVSGGTMGDTGSGMMMHDFSDDQNDRFSESYREMDRLNERIRQSNDPEVRGELMHEHIHELQNGMMMINEGWGSSEPDDSRRSDASDQWTRNMEQQMFRMQQMLNQLIDREAIELDNEIE